MNGKIKQALGIIVVLMIFLLWVYFYDIQKILIEQSPTPTPTPAACQSAGKILSTDIEGPPVLWQPDEGLWNFNKEVAWQYTCLSQTWCDTYFTHEETVWAQNVFYKHQHPPDCENSKFFVMPYEHPYGLGSAIHIKGAMLSIAMELGRVLVTADEFEWKTFAGSCQNPKFECYFSEFSSCSTGLHAPLWQASPIINNDNNYTEHRVIQLPGYANTLGKWWDRNAFVPTVFKEKGKDGYWFRAQMAKYLTRPNQHTLDVVAEVQKEVFPGGIIPHPLATMYVRHGDKYKEATLLPLSSYMDILKPVANKVNIKHIYLGTDDPLVIPEAVAKYPEFTWYYINSTARTADGKLSPMEIAAIDGGSEMMRTSLSDLYFEIQGDLFMGTRSSNWCRLVDELRKTNGKARAPYLSPEGTLLIEGR